MDTTGDDGGGNGNGSETGHEFDKCIDDKVCGYGTVTSEVYIKQEPCDTEDQLGGIESHVNIKDENMDEPMLAVEGSQETDLTTDTKRNSFIYCEAQNEFDDCIDDKIHVYETVLSGGYHKQEQYNAEDQQGGTHDYVDVKQEIIKDLMVVSQETELTTDTKKNSFMHCEAQDKIDDCTDDKIRVCETVLSRRYHKQERCDAEDQQGSTHDDVDMKQEIITDPMVLSQETELTAEIKGNSFIHCETQDEFDDCTDDKIHVYETAISRGYNQQVQCGTEDQQRGTHDHVDVKQEIIKDPMVASQETKLTADTEGNSLICYEMLENLDNCTDDKVCVYERAIGGAHNKQKQCDVENNVGGANNHIDMNCEIINDSMVVSQEAGCTTETKENIPLYCERCNEEYDLYCLKCPMLIRIFDGNKPNKTNNSLGWTLPKNIIDIHKTQSGVGIIALRAIPEGVVFGPFDGLSSTRDGTVYKWKLKNKKLVSTKDLRFLNWMQFLRAPDQRSNPNLTPFQYEDELYCRSDCYINAGDELLVRWDSDGEESEVRDTEYSYWKPRVCEKMLDTYACTFCCVGYKTVCQLAAHNSRCPEKRNRYGFCKEVIQCAFCKIYLDEKEYMDFHMELCFESKIETSVVAPRFPTNTDDAKLRGKYKCSMCDYGTSQKDKFDRHQQMHADLQMEKHAHVNYTRNHFKCQYCDKEFSRALFYVAHQKKEHSISIYKCDKCVFETTNKQDFTDHLTTYNDAKPYCCKTCGKWFKSEKTRYYHFSIFHKEKKKYKCSKCDFETIHKNCVRRHILVKHGHRKQFKCTRCSFKTRYKGHFEHHLRAHKGLKSTKREGYKMGFWSTRLRSRHKKDVRAIVDTIYDCRNCNFCTRRKWDYEKHLITCSVRNDVQQPDTSDV